MIKIQEYVKRRKDFVDRLEDNSIAIIIGSNQKFRNADSEYKFRQNSDCYYLSGINEPSVILVFEKIKDSFNFIIFTRVLTKEQLAWVTTSINLETAKSNYGADIAYNIIELDQKLPELCKGKTKVYYSYGLCSHFDKKASQFLPEKDKVVDPRNILHEMRLVKSESEIDLMRKSAKISANAHNQLLKFCKPGMYEYQLEAKFGFETLNSGSRELAYTAIVGAGNNAATLHYIDNNAEIKQNDLVLVDAGGEYDFYASDITRTFPAGGKFSSQQKDLYQVVLDAQKVGIAMAKPGNTWEELHNATLKTLVDGLIGLKLVSGSTEEVISTGSYKHFFMHYTGHWLGLDVHDCIHLRETSKNLKFKPGMVITVEPGLYISSNNDKAIESWRGMGIRIEDDVCITEKEPEILSKDAIKEINEIERIMQS